MPLDVPAIQKTLASEQIDGWLLYDFHGSNPIAVSLADFNGAHTTRRWYYFIPATGEPQKLVHAIEPFVLDGLRMHPIHLSKDEVEGYYHRFSNSTLWPLYHDVVVKPTFDRSWWGTYREVNLRFAEATARAAAPSVRRSSPPA